MHIEVAPNLATLFSKEHRQKEARSEDTSQHRQKPRPCAWAKLPNAPAMVGKQLRPDLDMTVLDLC
jgi:hypothetical protein